MREFVIADRTIESWKLTVFEHITIIKVYKTEKALTQSPKYTIADFIQETRDTAL